MKKGANEILLELKRALGAYEDMYFRGQAMMKKASDARSCLNNKELLEEWVVAIQRADVDVETFVNQEIGGARVE